MHRLTLILSDLFLPEEVGPAGHTRDMVALPNLEWLLRFASRRSPVQDWRERIAIETGIWTQAACQPARFVARQRRPDHDARSSWFATPLHLEARLDHVRLHERGLIRLAEHERQSLCAEFARHFGPELELHDSGPRGFLLSGLNAEQVTTEDPAGRLGADIAPLLARGPDSAPVRRLSAEIEMWLHGAALNHARERAGLQPVSTLWIWGGGATRAAAAAQDSAHERVYAGEDPFLAAVARAQTGADPLPVPPGLSGFEHPAAHAIVELSTVDRPAGELARIDQSWFGAARGALSQGSLTRVEVAANGQCLGTQRHAGYRFWRRHRHWSELLRHSPQAGQA